MAAPTAGLHFTPELVAALEARGFSRHFVTLHVGAGTFLPVKADDTAEHQIIPKGEASPETAMHLNAVQARGGRIVAVGTTSLRLLESTALGGGGRGEGKAATSCPSWATPRSSSRPATASRPSTC